LESELRSRTAPLGAKQSTKKESSEDLKESAS
jgi:hypothetical protein